ncbi:hypothetical protein TNIN_215651 [Trichonephila inaurata madagascariensis]|uniref:Uncharacterized protein n=1 Tax=Trichonephila inaurata madagascariensis TaxID=2747483 RepID=A0A8X7BUD9_9ARAC|nr:hypothetical protein TNIN_215651 [Trichonephila inaurata madagascariensis]
MCSQLLPLPVYVQICLSHTKFFGQIVPSRDRRTYHLPCDDHRPEWSAIKQIICLNLLVIPHCFLHRGTSFTLYLHCVMDLYRDVWATNWQGSYCSRMGKYYGTFQLNVQLLEYGRDSKFKLLMKGKVVLCWFEGLLRF